MLAKQDFAALSTVTAAPLASGSGVFDCKGGKSKMMLTIHLINCTSILTATKYQGMLGL